MPTIGAKMVHDQLAENSVFSPRNLVVNGLVLVGTVAGGYAFVGATAAAQGIGAFNSSFIPGLQKFWPDRRIQQQTNVLTYGYRTDQSTAIAKDDHGTYYAFFPISSFLIRQDLKPLFLHDPAAFINPGEVLPDIGGGYSHSDQGVKPRKGRKARLYADLRDYLLDLTATAVGETPARVAADRRKFSLRLQSELGMPCNLSKDSDKQWQVPDNCPLDPNDAQDLAELKRISKEKYLFAHASLNIVKIFAEGVMTVEVGSIPPTIDTVTFDGKADEASYWTVSPPAKSNTPAQAAPSDAKPVAKRTAGGVKAAAAPASTDTSDAATNTAVKTGIVAGKYLTDGSLTITAISVPSEPNAKVGDYIVDKSLKTVSEKSTDSSLAFNLQLTNTVPSGSKLTFQVAHKIGDATKSTSLQTLSNKFVYTVTYAATPAEPTIAKVAIDGDDKTEVWKAKTKLSGTATGTNLDGAEISVSALKIGGKPATVTEYIGALAEVPKSSNETSVDFQFQLLQKIPNGSTVNFEVSKKVGEGAVKSKPFVYTVTSPVPAIKKAAVAPKKNKSKPVEPSVKK